MILKYATIHFIVVANYKHFTLFTGLGFPDRKLVFKPSLIAAFKADP